MFSKLSNCDRICFSITKSYVMKKRSNCVRQARLRAIATRHTGFFAVHACLVSWKRRHALALPVYWFDISKSPEAPLIAFTAVATLALASLRAAAMALRKRKLLTLKEKLNALVVIDQNAKRKLEQLECKGQRYVLFVDNCTAHMKSRRVPLIKHKPVATSGCKCYKKH